MRPSRNFFLNGTTGYVNGISGEGRCVQLWGELVCRCERLTALCKEESCQHVATLAVEAFDRRQGRHIIQHNFSLVFTWVIYFLHLCPMLLITWGHVWGWWCYSPQGDHQTPEFLCFGCRPEVLAGKSRAAQLGGQEVLSGWALRVQGSQLWWLWGALMWLGKASCPAALSADWEGHQLSARSRFLHS